MFRKIRAILKKIVPKKLLEFLLPHYHFLMAYISAVWYRFPSREINMIGVTGTKGKTTVVELINAILEEAGHTTALSSTLRFKIADRGERNMHKMTMPGRFFLQRFIRQAVTDKCDYLILEMTSEGVSQSRHKFIDLDALVFTNLSPEHIESHGSFEAYKEAKLRIGRELSNSRKARRILVVNKDDEHSSSFLELDIPEKYTFKLEDAKPYKISGGPASLSLGGKQISTNLFGRFNIYNMLAAVAYTSTQKVGMEVVEKVLSSFSGVRGRVEFVNEGQNFNAVVDYAHTSDSLKKFYEIFKDDKNICIIGNTGGGRDTWKRPDMASIAEKNCEFIYLTNEDPYDENPKDIVSEMEKGLTKKENYEVIMDRRLAIRKALGRAKEGWNVLITGKGTDPYIMGPGGSKTPWDDASIVREELQNLNK